MMRTLLMIALLACGLIPGIARAEFTTPARMFDLGEHEVRYHLRGGKDAPVVIVLGGGPGFSSWNLEPVQQRLAELGYRAAIMDMLGVGENAAEVRGSPLDEWVSQVEGLRRELADDRPAVLVGHSWGALMAFVYTREFPDNVARLVLLNPVDPEREAMRTVAEQIDARRARERGERWDDEGAWAQDGGGPRAPEAHARHQIERNLPSYFLDYEQGRRYAESFDDSDFSARLNIEGWRAYRENPVDYATIREWAVPIDVIGCRQDLLMPANLDALRANLSLERVEVLDGCVHFPWEEVPRAFDEALGCVLPDPS
ncbi:MAG: alpha/beta fold hydrolase [Guyparkeria sp.]|uniref:alpha/beta fold hydrolase n=1 Tax=Guyparkeria sp. TaxID=2035736 RepID=UPI00397AE668